MSAKSGVLLVLLIAISWGCAKNTNTVETSPDPEQTEAESPGVDLQLNNSRPGNFAAKTGDFTMTLEGCLAMADRGGAMDGMKRNSSSSEPDQVTIDTSGVTIIISHHLNHACCLSAQSEVQVQGELILVNERIQGEPCRCMCSSTIRNHARLSPGDYRVEVRLEYQGEVAKTVHEQAVKVRSIRGGAGPQEP